MGIKSGANGVKKIFVGITSVKSVYRGTNLVWSDEGLDLWRYSNTEIEGKTLLYEYLGSWNIDILKVPKVGGRAVLNYGDLWARSSSRNTPFSSNPNVVNVDLQGVPVRGNSLSEFFYKCNNLRFVRNINNTTKNFYECFSDCSNFNQNIKIPNNATNMFHCFYRCGNFNQKVRLPNSIDDIGGMYRFCEKYNQNITVPPNVYMMYYVLEGSSNFSSWVNIHSRGVSYIDYCFNTTNSSCIPNVFFIWKYANNTVTTTANSLKAAGWNFTGDGSIAGKSPNRIRCWDDGANYERNTKTGYNGTHCILSKWHGNLDTFLNNNVVWTTPVVPEKLFLSNIPTAINYPCFRANTVITSVDFGTEIPWADNRLGLIKNTKNDKTINGAFEGCTALRSIKGVINSSVTSILDAFTDSANISEVDVIIPEGVTNARGAYYNTPNLTHYSPLPSTITGMQGCFDVVGKVEGNLGGSVIIPPSATNLSSLFRNRQENVGNVYILSPSVSSMPNIWANYKNSFKKPFYIYYTYSNGTYTTTYNKFFGKNSWAGWYNTTGNNTNADPKYSTASNFYVYNLSNVYNNLWSYEIYVAPALKLVKLSKWKGTDPHIAVMANAPDWNVGAITTNCFTGCRTLRTLALYNVSLNNTSNANNITNMFRNCYNLRVVQGLKLDSPYVYNADFSNSYANCYNLRVACPLTNNILKAAYTYDNCRNLNFNCQLGNSVSNLRGTFRNCVNLDRPIEIPESAVDIAYMFQNCSNLKKDFKIPNNVTNMYSTFYGCTRLSNEIEIFSKEIVSAIDCFTLSTGSKTIYIPFYYSNGSHTKTFNSFYSAGYIYENGSSTGRNSTTFYDITY